MGVAGFCVVSVIKDFNGKLEGAAHRAVQSMRR